MDISQKVHHYIAYVDSGDRLRIAVFNEATDVWSFLDPPDLNGLHTFVYLKIDPIDKTNFHLVYDEVYDGQSLIYWTKYSP